MRKIYLITNEKGERVAFSTYNAFLNFFPFEDVLILKDQFEGSGKPFQKKEFKKEQYYFEKYKLNIETVEIVADRLVGFI